MTYKFRGKSKNGDFYIYGMPTYDCKYIFNDKSYLSPDNFEVIPETIVQYIGRNDDNGKEMYNGDTVKVDCSGVGVSFDDGIYKIQYSEVDCAFFLVQLDGKHAIAFNECYGYEVIESNENKYVWLPDLSNKTILELSDLDGKTIKARISVTKYSPKISID